MIRLILLALLVLNLQAKESSSHKDTPFFKAATSLYDSLLKAHNSALQAALKAQCAPNDMDRVVIAPEVVAQHYKEWLTLAAAMIDHVPFMTRLKSLPLYHQIRGFETLHAFGLVRAKISGKMDCKKALKHGIPPLKPLQAKQLLDDLQHNLEFYYPLLLNASKQGLPLESFLDNLNWDFSFTFSAKDYQRTLLNRLRFDSKDDDHNLKTLKGMLSKGNSPTILRLKTLKAGADNFLFNRYDYGVAWQEERAYYQYAPQFLGLSLWDISRLHQYYAYRFKTWLGGVRTLSPSNPPVPLDRVGFFGCLNASKADIPACNALIKQRSAFFYFFFRSTRLLAFHDQPCLYLTPQNTLQNFPSKDPLCQILQANPPQMGRRVPTNLINAFKKAQESLITMMDTPPYAVAPFKQSLQAILQATPLATLQGPKWNQLLSYEQLHLFALLRGSVYYFRANLNKHRPKFISIPMLAYHYLNLIHFFYAPLIEAAKQGLDPSAYLQAIQSTQKPQNPCKEVGDCDEPTDIPESPWLTDLSIAQVGADLTNRYQQGNTIPMVDWDLPAHDEKHTFASNSDLAKWLTPKSAPLWDLHYIKQVVAFFYNADIYTDSLLHPQKLSINRLRESPSACLHPKYLNSEAQATCLDIFQQRTYDIKDLQQALQSMRLLSIDDSPCVYLDSQNKLQTFKSSNPLCHALQTNLTKDTQWSAYFS